jgi:hypothetical protein
MRASEETQRWTEWSAEGLNDKLVISFVGVDAWQRR